MKAIQVMFDEEMLEELDATEEVRRQGRSAVLRQAAADFLARSKEEAIRRSYEQAYANGDGLGKEFAGWESQGTGAEE